MPTITIEQSGCRACNLCVEICPTEVFEMDASDDFAKVVRQDDCIGCTSCMYLCPSRCLTVTEYKPQRPFYRLEENTALVSKFLQRKTLGEELTDADYEEALRDVSKRLSALSDSMVDTMGRGQKALGRQSGGIAAVHLPEIYECATLEEILDRLQLRFRHSFAFEPQIIDGGDQIVFKFGHCALKTVVSESGQKQGDGALCIVFHEYLAGLLGAFTKRQYMIELLNAGSACELKFEARK